MKSLTTTIKILLTAFLLSACVGMQVFANAKPSKYHPQTKKELIELLNKKEMLNGKEIESIKLDEIDTSKIADMSFLFANMSDEECKEIMNASESEKETLKNNKVNVDSMIYSCKNPVKRQDFSGIESWNVSSVVTMQGMFTYASSFNQPLHKWNVSKVKDMMGMFAGAESFNQPLNKWNVSNVKNMISMFDEAKSFNQPLNAWNVSKVENMMSMFKRAESFNQNLNAWNVSKVENMGYMFAFAKSFNQPLDSWDVSSVENMDSMFYKAKSFNQNLDSWGDKIPKYCNIESMFYNSAMENNPPKWWEKRLEEMSK